MAGQENPGMNDMVEGEKVGNKLGSDM